MSEARDRWLSEGVDVLADEGAAGVRIDRIAARLGLSKGSFHHHFQGAAGFKRDLLTYLEDLQVSALATGIAQVQRDGASTPEESLRELVFLLGGSPELYRPELETALRAWALTDEDAARTQASIDEARLNALQSIWRQISDDEEVVRVAALLPYVIALGSRVIMPPLETEDLQALYTWILRLVPQSLPSTGTGA